MIDRSCKILAYIGYFDCDVCAHRRTVWKVFYVFYLVFVLPIDIGSFLERCHHPSQVTTSCSFKELLSLHRHIHIISINSKLNVKDFVQQKRVFCTFKSTLAVRPSMIARIDSILILVKKYKKRYSIKYRAYITYIIIYKYIYISMNRNKPI